VLPGLATAGDPAGGPAGDPGGTATDTDRLRVFEAVGGLLDRAAVRAPVVVVLDDLHWADVSTVDLLRFLAHRSGAGAVMLVAAYRPAGRRAEVAGALADLAAAAELVTLTGLAPDEVADLVGAEAGEAAAARWAALVHRRSGGHPFFARELTRLLATGGDGGGVPDAVRDVIGRRLAPLSGGSRGLLDVVAVAGTALPPDVLTEVAGEGAAEVAALVDDAVRAGLLTPAGGFGHDLFRETVYAALPPSRRADLHHRVATALAGRRERGGEVFPAELARHFAAAVPVGGPEPALAWARAAAAADTSRFAFAEAAGHLARVRSAVADAGVRIPEADLVGLLVEEADLRLRSGDAAAARSLLDTAWVRVRRGAEPELLGAVALGLDRVGARFAMPRTELIEVLDAARAALDGRGTPAEAQVTAAAARQLQHSVPADRPRAGPLAEHAVDLARGLDDPATLASCLLAHHDAIWMPGTAPDRAGIATEIADLARRAGDPERLAQALLLVATAELEAGSPAFRATLEEYRYVTEGLRQPRHDYLLATRQAALTLLDGDIDAGDRRSAEAEALGEAVGDTDAGNVRMTQRLEITRARADVAELREMAAAAVRWWVGAPVHAHAVAAGFLARAGDLDAARRELDTVLALRDWRAERSYLWSMFVGELTTAAIALDDRELCRQLRDDLLPLADACAVGAALVSFLGAYAHHLGLLHAALGEPEPAAHRLGEALDTHRRLGARAWEAETRRALAALSAPRPAEVPAPDGAPRLARVGDMWEASYRGRTAYLRDAKGLHDLAALLARPGADLPALELAGGSDGRAGAPADRVPVLDRAALVAYRRRLAELDAELDDAAAMGDEGRRRRATDEREHLVAELRRATRPGGRSRVLAPSAAERARKAVSARIRDAIHRIAEVLPELGAHLDRTVRTGTTCRYDHP
jgi:hypothetical protein